MSENIISKILQAEAEYHAALEKAAQESEIYKATLRGQQSESLKEIKQQSQIFEETCNAQYSKELTKQQEELEQEFLRRKQELKNSQQKKAELISERLKKEVLSLYGNC